MVVMCVAICVMLSCFCFVFSDLVISAPIMIGDRIIWNATNLVKKIF